MHAGSPREAFWHARQRPCIAVAAVAQAWCMAMYRDVERGLGVLDLVFRMFTGGFQLPSRRCSRA